MRVHKIRSESFGGIVGTVDPVALFWVDREYLASHGLNPGRQELREPGEPQDLRGPGGKVPAWRETSRPVEAELAVTSRCNLACPCCYQDAGPGGQDVPYEELCDRLEAVASLGVFHVAFGGGEPLLHPQLLQLAERARQLNIIPSLSTNGTLVTRVWADTAASLFGRVNVSLDLPGGPRAGQNTGGTPPLRALEVLTAAGVTAGANFIVTRHNWSALPEVFHTCREAGADSVLILRPKPGGRGSLLYRELTLTRDQARGLVPLLLEAAELHGFPFHLDCALGPLLMRAAPDPKLLTLWAASGCIAGNLLVTVDLAGYVRPCSHLTARACHFSALPDGWLHSDLVNGFRLRHARLQGRCGHCHLAAACGGGCAAVNEFYGLPLHAPDPDLPCE